MPEAVTCPQSILLLLYNIQLSLGSFPVDSTEQLVMIFLLLSLGMILFVENVIGERVLRLVLYWKISTTGESPVHCACCGSIQTYTVLSTQYNKFAMSRQ